MYEQMKNEFIMTLTKNITFSNEDISKILSCLDITMYNYDVSKKETSIIPYGYELPELAKTFIVCKSIEGYSEGTLYNYKKSLTNFFQWIQKAPENVVTNDIRIYLYTYQKERGVSNRSLDKVLSSIRVFYKWMYLEGYIERDPSASIPSIKYEKKPKTPCTQIDLEYLRRACKTKKERAVLEVLYSTGCRVGELVILKKSDINWVTKEVHLFGKGKKHRTSFLNAKSEVALKEYLSSREDNNEYLFVSDRKPHNQMHVCGIQKIIRILSERVNSTVAKNVTPHILRHTTATVLMNAKADITSIQKILGHENINTTMTYIHTTMDSAKADHLKAVV